MNFVGKGKRLDDVDLPRIGKQIGVGEDELHAFMDTESRGRGFDAQGRPIILFEPHIFYEQLPHEKRPRAIAAGLASATWGTIPYGTEASQYPKLERAMGIDQTAALKACSWGLFQILGKNHKMVGYPTVQAMVEAMMDDEENHLQAAVTFLKAAGLDDDLRRHDWPKVARGYNGPGYRKNNYDAKMAQAFLKWQRIPDTKWDPDLGKPVPKNPTPKPVQRNLSRALIEEYQERLKSLGGYYGGRIDGIWGLNTTGAIAAFQHNNGLPVTGDFDPATVDALMSDDAKPRVVSPERRAATAADIAPVAPIINEANSAESAALPTTVVLGGTAVTGFVAQVAGYATQVKDILGDVPFPVWCGVVAGIAAVTGFLWYRAKRIKERRVQMYRSGEMA